MEVDRVARRATKTIQSFSFENFVADVAELCPFLNAD